jgi:hypothetical protein
MAITNIDEAKVILQRISALAMEMYERLGRLQTPILEDSVEGKIELTSTQKDKVNKIINRLAKKLKDEIAKLK